MNNQMSSQRQMRFSELIRSLISECILVEDFYNLDISIKSIEDYDEIILIGSGKGVASVSKINDLKWKTRKSNCYTKLNKIYNSLV